MKFFFIYLSFIFIILCSFKDINSTTKDMTKENKKITTFTFDFDNTMITEDILIEVIRVASNYDASKVEKVIVLIQEKRKDNIFPILQYNINEINDILGVKLHKSHFEKAITNIVNRLTYGLVDIIQDLQDQDYQIIVIGGGYSTMIAIQYIVENYYRINSSNLYSGLSSFDKDGFLIFDNNLDGFTNASTEQRVGNRWTKSEVIKELKAQGVIKGQVVHIGDGLNDLETQESGEVHTFIGFGINKIDKKVKQNANIYVENIWDFQKEIKKLTSKNHELD